MSTMQEICADLEAEQLDLQRVIQSISEPMWDTATPAIGWSIRDQISHLAFFDDAASRAIVDREAFKQDELQAAPDAARYIAIGVERGRSMAPVEVLRWWQIASTTVLGCLEGADGSVRFPWYGQTMTGRSMASARLMETWAHGQDIFDALGLIRAPTPRLWHLCNLAVRALPFSFAVRGRPVPAEQVRVELDAPGGSRWTWNDAATDVVRGDALDFSLVATQRRHLADTALVAEGSVANEWPAIMQAFAGPPGPGRPPGMPAAR